MINGLLLLFSPGATWDRIVRAERGLIYILVTCVAPMMLLCLFAEGFGLVHWGKWVGEVPHIRRWPPGEALIFELGQAVVLGFIILLNSALVKSVGETFHTRHTFLQSFTVLAYGFCPLYLAHILNAFTEIAPWVSWLAGILMTLAVVYHGVPRVMEPDPAHAFGLYMSTALLLLLSTGLLELVVSFYLSGKLDKLDRFISSAAGRLPF